MSWSRSPERIGEWVRSLVLAAATLLLFGGLAAGAGAIEFVEATASVGITELNSSWGSSWGDFDGDGDPDLWVTNHTQFPTLYLNQVDQTGTFTDIAPSILFDFGDAHGAQWTDFDNDGDQDLIQLGGSGGQLTPSPNKLFVNIGGLFFSEQAVLRGIDLPLGRGRNPLMFDWNGDGLLDLFYTALARDDGADPAGIFEQQPDGTFTRVEGLLPNDPLSLAPVMAQLTDITFDGVMEVATFNRKVEPPADEGWKIFGTGTTPFTDLSAFTGPPQMFGIMDVAIYDVNGDLRPDQLLVRAGQDGSDLVQITPTQLQARVHPFDGGEGIDIVTTGDAHFLIPSSWFWLKSEVFIGAGGSHPASLTFTLDEDNPDHQGLTTFTQGVDRGVYIGYDTASETWNLRVSGGSELNTIVHTQDPIVDLVAIGFSFPAFTSLQDHLFTLGPGGFTQETTAAGIPVTPCISVAGGDFDNDMDVDFYLACARTITNAPNILLENDGTGVFTEVPLAGGAEGSTVGRSESVTTADYDGDGFLDLFLTNGAGWPPFNYGPHQLYRNVGNANHWIEIDLEGVLSNRDGIGARVFVTAGGKTQLRERTGGLHIHSQDHHRLHFGLGTNTVASQLRVEWPSGVTQTVNDVPVDQVLSLREPGPSCDVESAQPVYVDGEVVTLSLVRYVNPALSLPLNPRIRLTKKIPGGTWYTLLDVGADGSFTFPAGAIIDLSPLSILQVTSTFPPRGTDVVRCEIIDPVSGRTLASDGVAFEVQ